VDREDHNIINREDNINKEEVIIKVNTKDMDKVKTNNKWVECQDHKVVCNNREEECHKLLNQVCQECQVLHKECQVCQVPHKEVCQESHNKLTRLTCLFIKNI